VQRNLRRLARGADEQQDADQRRGNAGGAREKRALIRSMSSVPNAW
jgi:hypothetical protein